MSGVRPPAPLRRIDSGGVSALLREGRGTPMVLLHGIGSQAESFRPLIDGLETPRPILAWDMPGYGGSGPLPGDWPMPPDYAATLLALLDRMGWRQVHLVGHSLGCVVATATATAAADRVETLTLIAPAVGYATPRGATLPPSVAERLIDLQELGPEAFAKARSARLVFDAGNRPAVLAATVQAMAGVRDPGYTQASRMLASADLYSEAARVSCPTHVICGTEDLITPPLNARRLHEALAAAAPGSSHRFDLVPAAGHAICLEKPGELARLIGERQP